MPTVQAISSKSYDPLIELIRGKLHLFRYRDGRSPYWNARIYLGDRRYANRSLKTTDSQQAEAAAYDLWSTLRQQVLTTGVATGTTIQREIAQWIQTQEQRHKGGEISGTLWRGKRSTFSLYVAGYVDHKGWKSFGDIPADGWVGYRVWRKEEGWRLTNRRNGTNRLKNPPKDSTINRELTLIGEWFRFHLIPNGLAAAVPPFGKKPKAERPDEFAANPAFEPKDWQRISVRLKSWAEDPNGKNLEWRQVVRHFILVSAAVGWRPDSEGLETNWNQVKQRRRDVVLDGGDIQSEHIAEIRIWDRKNKRWREGSFLAGDYLLRLRDLYKKWHQDHTDWYDPKADGLIFVNPKTGQRLNYNSIFRAYKRILSDLDADKPLAANYSLYSCRSYYVTERLREGVDIYVVTKQTGHSLEICRRHYESLRAADYADEATKRTYGKAPTKKEAIPLL